MGVSERFGLGINQQAQNLVGSRALNTVYYNTTGRPILVCVVTGSPLVSTRINGEVVQSYTQTPTNTVSVFIVPTGASYEVESASGINAWMELR